MRGAYRSIGINRNDFMALIQIRPDMEADCRPVEWIAYGPMHLTPLFHFMQDVEETTGVFKQHDRAGFDRELLLVEPSDRSDGRTLPIINLCSMWSVIRKELQQRDTS